MPYFTARIMVTKAGENYEEIMFDSIKSSNIRKASAVVSRHANAYVKATDGLSGWRIITIELSNAVNAAKHGRRMSRQVRKAETGTAVRVIGKPIKESTSTAKQKSKSTKLPRFKEGVCKFSDIVPKFPKALSHKLPPAPARVTNTANTGTARWDAANQRHLQYPWEDDDYNGYIM